MNYVSILLALIAIFVSSYTLLETFKRDKRTKTIDRANFIDVFREILQEIKSKLNQSISEKRDIFIEDKEKINRFFDMYSKEKLEIYLKKEIINGYLDLTVKIDDAIASKKKISGAIRDIQCFINKLNKHY